MKKGFIYEYYRTDNNEVVYRGHSFMKGLESVDYWHRKGNEKCDDYYWSPFRCALRTPFGKKLKNRFVDKPRAISEEKLVALEGKRIREARLEGQCYLNWDTNPVRFL